ncbi:MAG: efflux RND transporter periplasmic adaptor subunit [Candidatus Hydrogenedentes bacterium]|nr:efflux RND transporter periplasmic adaptor subunit [Candidatus Hydrogenedentota bacterium]
MTISRKKIIGTAIVAVLLGFAVLSMRPQPALVEIGKPEKRAVREYITEEAKTRLRDEYTVDMPLSGTLKRMGLEVGDVVEVGAILAEIDTFDLEHKIRAAEFLIQQSQFQIDGLASGKPKKEDTDTASVRIKEMSDQLQIAETQHRVAGIESEQARREYERVKKLVEEGVAAQSLLDDAQRTHEGLLEQVDRAQLAVAAARKNVEIAQLAASRVASSMDDNEYMRQVYGAEIQRLEAELAILQSDFKKAMICAPVSGPVLEKYIENTRVLAAGTPIMKLGDLGTMEIESDVLSEEVVAVTPGDAVELIGKALGEAPVLGKVDRIYPSAFQKISSLGIEQQRVKTIIAFDNSALQLRAGTRLDVRIITDETTDAIAVPERSVFRREGEWYVFVVDGGSAELRKVTVGLKNDTWAAITSGLELEEAIILDPKNDLEPGSRVAAR